jgi:hypothetical protein
VFIWYIFSGFGIMYLEKSGNPACECAWAGSLHSVSRPRYSRTVWPDVLRKKVPNFVTISPKMEPN